jgi:hypothetical protein
MMLDGAEIGRWMMMDGQCLLRLCARVSGSLVDALVGWVAPLRCEAAIDSRRGNPRP